MNEMELIMFNLTQIEEDGSIPKSVRAKVRCAIHALREENGKSVEVKIDKALQELDELSDDPNIQAFTRSQIWEIVSSLSSQMK